mgnify:CR=1 FL=1
MSIFGIFSLLGGVGLFLFGMTIMSSGLRNAAGANLQSVLEKATTNKYVAVLVGLFMTALIQSSSATDVMVIGFVNAGLMKLTQAIGVIMGANIGTTVTAQITAFNLSAYAPLILFFGVVMYLFIKKSMVKYIGEIIMGFGMLFVGISTMKLAIAPLSGSREFIHFISNLNNPALSILFGVLFTALLQSSSSSTVIFQTFAVQGLLSYNTAIYLVIGAAIGSVTPNLLASLTTNREGKRTALLNLMFNLFRAVILVVLINVAPNILNFICGLSPHDVGRQIANTHTFFAIIAVIVQLPFTNQIIKLSRKIIPLLPIENERNEERTLKYMINLSMMPISMAIDQAHREVTRMGRIAAKNLRNSLKCFFDYTGEMATSVRVREETVNILNHSIADAMVEFKALELNSENMHKVSVMTISITDLERLSDHAENIVEYAEEMNRKKVTMTDDAWQELREMADDVLEEVELALDIFESGDYTKLDRVEELEHKVDSMETQLVGNHVERLMNSHCEPMAGVVFCDMVTDLERCGDHGINLAYGFKEGK